MDNYYAGIGSRETPEPILDIMTKLSEYIYTKTDLTLRSGGADGADAAFMKGCHGRAESCRDRHPEAEDIPIPLVTAVLPGPYNDQQIQAGHFLPFARYIERCFFVPSRNFGSGIPS